MNPVEYLDVAFPILVQPTAPFHEDAVRYEIERQLEDCPNVSVERDDFGNLVARYRGGKATAKAEFAFAAHMDHPAYVGKDFLGGVPESYRAKKPPTKKYGPFRMWDLPEFEVRNGKIYARVCDDLIGCACIVAMMRELQRENFKGAVDGLFTRAEEVGFVGAMKLAESGLVPKSTTIVSLETSSLKGGPVKMGKGVIVRIGDRTSVFDSAASARLLTAAQAAKLPHQRALMQGGTCEATAYALYGYRTAAMCVALGNYHNCGPKETIAPEFVSVVDAVAMAQLCVDVTKGLGEKDPLGKLLERLEKNITNHSKYF